MATHIDPRDLVKRRTVAGLFPVIDATGLRDLEMA
jgi:hypothetical protein